ncbi:MAG: hypothetical protein GX270_15540 [Clostridiaceae bacterium]|jgi:hypothetical protein|nr:hypothetical protein [Clostridiaceae bacterium]
MNSIEKQQPIKRESLSEEHYFQSFIQEAHRLKLLSEAQLEDIQMQSVKLLVRQTQRYNSGDSSSVRVEVAQSIFQSALYSIGVYLKSLPDTDMGLSEIINTPLEELHKKGRKLIEKKINIARHLLHLVQQERIETENIAYRDTIDKGLSEFFSAYDADFSAHDTACSIDYPLNIDKMEMVGIEYILDYLQKLYWENKFCKKFSSNDIACVMRGYDEKYTDLLVNIFRIVFTNTLGCTLLGKSAEGPKIDCMDREKLQHKLQYLSQDQLYEVLEAASIKLCKQFDLTNDFFQNYISQTIRDICERLNNALENGRLESIFVSSKEKTIKPVIHFMDGDKMEDELFRKLANEIRECRFVTDKISIIHRDIHSISDLVDILEADCLFGNEFAELFQVLGDNELAMLFNLLPINKTDSNLEESEKEWQLKLDDYLEGIESNRKNNIIELADKIEMI